MPSDNGYENQFGASCDLEAVKHYISYDNNLYYPLDTGSEFQEEVESQLTNENIPECVWEDWNNVHPVKVQKYSRRRVIERSSLKSLSLSPTYYFTLHRQ